jgi:competence protein ComEA
MVMNRENNDKIGGFLVLLLILLIFYSLKPASLRSTSLRPRGEEHLFIQVTGGVKFPGVYGFSRKPNLLELIARAGGLRSQTELSEASRYSTFSTGAKIAVSLTGDGPSYSQGEISAFYKTTLNIPISLNEEWEMGLTAIPGIGPGLAKAIITERSKRGGFKSLDEILAIDGIGPKLYRKVRPYLTL